MYKPIITSILDTDLYKFTMLYAIWKNGHNKVVRYEFDNRKKEPFTQKMVNEIVYQIGLWRGLKFEDDELIYLKSLDFFDNAFIDYLKDYDLSKYPVPDIRLGDDDQLKITVVGPWQETILYEVPILAIVNEVYFAFYKRKDGETMFDGFVRLHKKIEYYNTLNSIYWDLNISEFGTRRRFGKVWHETLLKEIIEKQNGWFIGTSNVEMAKKFNSVPIGTMAHEYLQAFQVIKKDDLGYHLWHALQEWKKVFGNKLATALTDSITSEVFIETTGFIWDAWDSFRHDSGDPIDWALKITKNPTYKNQTLVFSDGLDPKMVTRIWREVGQHYPVAFGIGTNFTNDIGLEPLNIVMKMQEYDGQPVSKISDEPGKTKGENAEELKLFFEDFLEV